MWAIDWRYKIRTDELAWTREDWTKEMKRIDDMAVIRRALAGEQEAYDLLYRTYYSRVYGMVVRRADDRNTVDDLVQVTFTRAFLSLKSFKGKAAFSTWLTQIALNVCRSHLRTQITRKAWLVQTDDPELIPTAIREMKSVDDPEREMVLKERTELVRKSIKGLPERYQKAMWMRYVKDWSYEEITQALQVPIGTVKTWLCRARRQLKGEFRRLGLQTV